MTKQQNLKPILCVDYPGLVENEREAIRTLGGMQRLNQTFSRKNTKLLLNFNPDNIFSKMLCSTQITEPEDESKKSTTTRDETLDASNANNDDAWPETNINQTSTTIPKQNEFFSMPCLLMSVKKADSVDATKYDVKIIGKIKKVYTFQKIADFQYLPMCCSTAKKTSSESESAAITKYSYTAFYDKFLFNNIQDCDYEFRENNLPHQFILPPFFSRFDDPVSYAFRSETVKKGSLEDNKPDEPRTSKSVSEESSKKADETGDVSVAGKDDSGNTELIRSMRQERSSQAYLITFKCKDVPSGPNEKLKVPRNETQIECIESLKKLFEQRPCFLKSVLLCVTSYSANLLKECLPYVAYYFTTGPLLSIRFGYDPRQNADAKIYQMIDYRLRNNAEPDQIVKAKPRSSYHKRKFRSDLADPELDEYKNFKIEKEMYKFNPNKLPASRNVFYQICDIEDDDVQALVNSDVSVSNKCTEKDGWFSGNFQDRCRNIMSLKHEKLSKYLAQEEKKSKPG